MRAAFFLPSSVITSQTLGSTVICLAKQPTYDSHCFISFMQCSVFWIMPFLTSFCGLPPALQPQPDEEKLFHLTRMLILCIDLEMEHSGTEHIAHLGGVPA